MSTAERFLEPEEIDEFIQETLADDYLYSIGEEDAEIGLCPFITFYIYHQKDDFLRMSEQMIRHPKTQNWISREKARAIDWYANAKSCAEDGYEAFWLMATDQNSATTTPRWGFSAKVSDNTGMRYTTLKLTFRHYWYKRNN